MAGTEKIENVLQLARFKVGTTVWWVVLRPVEMPNDQLHNSWMGREHPKVLFERKVLAPLWKFKWKLPHLHALDFFLVVRLATQRPLVEDFMISRVERSANTGEFSYYNQHDEEMPEKYLFSSKAAAEKEKTRVKKIIKGWLETW